MQEYPDRRMGCEVSPDCALQFSPVMSGQEQQCVFGVQTNPHSLSLPVQLTSD